MKTPAFLFCRLACLVLILLLPLGCVHSGKPGNGAAQELRVGVSSDAPPLIYKTGDNYQGLESDFARQLGSYLGMKVRFVEVPWEQQIPSLQEGKTDIIMSGMTITRKRSFRVDFSKPYLRSGQIMLVRAKDSFKYSGGIYGLAGGRIPFGVVENTAGDFFASSSITRPNLIRFKTSRQAVDALLAGRIDAVVHDAPILCHFAAKNEGQLTPLLQMATEEYLAWAVNKTNRDLLARVNQFIDEQSASGELEKTIKRWVPYM